MIASIEIHRPNGVLCGRKASNKSLKPTPKVRLWLVRGPGTDRSEGFAVGETVGRLNSMLCSIESVLSRFVALQIPRASKSGGWMSKGGRRAA